MTAAQAPAPRPEAHGREVAPRPEACGQGGASGISLRQWLPLIGLACSSFVFNTSEFMPIGLLSDIAASFGLDEAGAGIMITVYAWAVMLLSLPLMLAASRVEFKRLLLLVVIVFAAGQVLSAVAPSFGVLVLARLVVACAHAVFWSIVAVVAARLVDARHASLAISMIATGSAVAQIFGLPMGRAVGLAVGWRATFSCVGAVAAALALYLAFVFPPMAQGEPFRLGRVPALLKNRLLIGIYLSTALYATAYYTAYSYIEPFLAQLAGLAPNVITLALMAFGVAGMLASVICTRFYDGHRVALYAVSVAGVAASLFAMGAAAGAGMGGVVVLFLVWGICATIYGVASQAELIRCTRADDAAVAMSVYSGIFNLGIGGGSALGGVVVTTLGIGVIGLVGGLIGVASLVLAALLVLRCLPAGRAHA